MASPEASSRGRRRHPSSVTITVATTRSALRASAPRKPGNNEGEQRHDKVGAAFRHTLARIERALRDPSAALFAAVIAPSWHPARCRRAGRHGVGPSRVAGQILLEKSYLPDRRWKPQGNERGKRGTDPQIDRQERRPPHGPGPFRSTRHRPDGGGVQHGAGSGRTDTFAGRGRARSPGGRAPASSGATASHRAPRPQPPCLVRAWGHGPPMPPRRA